ncbi:GNAT family N-acetyltransferase [Paenibacillus sp. XY044]|uniref:GNAT family N-acetyltransferase n=1 Tax=Paenibacillus sp. XY044 TaxID=2026089 RepID=UPI0015C5F552|nr:GNAT family N-acetyltransferase [Paenibacillus sp. XY044]
MKIRLLYSSELKQAADLSDLVFGKPGQPSMGKSFPALFQPGISHSYGAFTDEGELVAFMGLAPDVMRIGEARLNVFSIGSVCTHPDYRGQNLASTLLAECMKHAQRSGASLVFVSGGRSLYRRADCYDFGRVHYAMLDNGSASALLQPDTDHWSISPMQPEDTFGISGIISGTSPAYEQGPAQLLTLLGSSAIADITLMRQETLIARRNGTVEAFLAAAVPTVQPSVPAGEPAKAVEWGGHPQAVARLLAETLQRQSAQRLEVPVPWQEQTLLNLLQQAGAAVKSGPNSGTVWIADAQSLLTQCSPLLKVDWKSFIRIEEAAGGRSYTLTNKGQELVLDDSGLLSLLFDPESPHLAWAPEAFGTIPLPYLAGLHYI